MHDSWRQHQQFLYFVCDLEKEFPTVEELKNEERRALTGRSRSDALERNEISSREVFVLHADINKLCTYHNLA